MGLLDWLTGGSSSSSSGSESSGSSSTKASAYSGNFNYNHNSSSYTQTKTGDSYSSGSSSGSTSNSYTGVQIGGTTASQGVAAATGKTTTTYTTPGTSTTTPTVSGAVSGTSTIKTSTTGTGGSTGGTATPTSNIQTAQPVQSNISGTSSNPTWTQTYASTSADGSKTTETWVSSDGRQVAFAGISASDLSKYYADKGDLENAATFAQISGQSSGTSYSASNWRNSEAGVAISLGTATTEQKLSAIAAGASTDSVGLYESAEVFETTSYYQSTHPDEATTKIMYTGGGDYPTTVYDGDTIIVTPSGGAYALDSDGNLVHTSDASTWGLTETSSGIPTETTNPGNIPTTTPGGDSNIAGAGTQEIIINIPATETTPTGGTDSSFLRELLIALFGQQGQTNYPSDGTSDNSSNAEETAEESDTEAWKQYVLPVGIAVVVVVLAVFLFGGDKGGKKK